MRPPVRSALVLTLLVSLSASAADGRVFVGPFSGPKKQAAAARTQVQKAVCKELDCVAASKVSTRGKPDWKKLKRHKVDAVLLGKVTKAGKKVSVELRLMTKATGKPVWKQKFSVAANGRALAPTLEKMVNGVLDGLPGGAGPGSDGEAPVASAGDEGSASVEAGAAGAEVATAPAGESTDADASSSTGSESNLFGSSESQASSTSAQDSASEANADSSDSADSGVEQSADSAPGPSEGFPLFTVQAGLDMLNRSYAVSELQTGNLRDYSAPLILAPRVLLTTHPLGGSGGALAGLGAELDFAFSLALKSGLEGGPTFPTSMSRFDLGVLYAFRPMSGSNLAIIPKLGFRKQSFSVGEAGGQKLDGLPGISYGGFKVAVGVEAPFAAESFLVFAQLGFLPSLSTGEIGAAPYFSSAKASGLELGAGMGFRMTPQMELRLTGQFTSYSLTFESGEGAEYVASGASDRYLGAALAARYRF